MRSFAKGTAFLLIIFCFLGKGAEAVDAGLDFETQKMFGHTTFNIQAIQYFPSLETYVKVESELEFPLDVFLVGANLRIEGKLKTGELWSVNLGASRNVNHPSSYMKDSDWFGLPQYNLREKFSFTESDAELKALRVYAEGRLGLVIKPNFVLELLGGYEFQDFSFEIFGVRGWQGVEEEIVYFDTLHSINVGDYDVKYHIIYGGVAAHSKISPRLSMGAKGSIAPRVSAKDHDDHLLRYKTADGDCSGMAFQLGTDLRWIMFETPSKSNWSLGLGFDYVKIDTKGTQDQHWYGDDPASPDVDDTGQTVMGIKEKIKSQQITIKARVGYEF